MCPSEAVDEVLVFLCVFVGGLDGDVCVPLRWSDSVEKLSQSRILEFSRAERWVGLKDLIGR